MCAPPLRHSRTTSVIPHGALDLLQIRRSVRGSRERVLRPPSKRFEASRAALPRCAAPVTRAGRGAQILEIVITLMTGVYDDAGGLPPPLLLPLTVSLLYTHSLPP